jgi:aryl-alcohol dehydrogenase-like predicted oxidoreductase
MKPKLKRVPMETKRLGNVGARNAKQVEANGGAAALHVTAKEIAEIESVNEDEPTLVTAA